MVVLCTIGAMQFAVVAMPEEYLLTDSESRSSQYSRLTPHVVMPRGLCGIERQDARDAVL